MSESKENSTEFIFTEEMYNSLLKKIENLENQIQQLKNVLSSDSTELVNVMKHVDVLDIVNPPFLNDPVLSVNNDFSNGKNYGSQPTSKANLPSRERILEELRDIMKKLPFGSRWIRLDMFYLALHVIGEKRFELDKIIMDLYRSNIIDLSEGGPSNYSIKTAKNKELRRITLKKLPRY